MTTTVAMIALGPHALVSLNAVRKDLAARFPALPELADLEDRPPAFTFKVGEQQVVGGLMPAPIPWGDLEGPCATSVLWPDAADALKSHVEHLIVAVQGDATPIARLTLLTQVVASILSTCEEALGVFWCPASLVVQPPLFIDFATQILPHEPLLYIWLDMRVGANPDGTTSGFTHGMESLGLMEFETQDSRDTPDELRERFLGLAHYLLEKGPVIQDGDTIGENDRDRIRVVYANSVFGHAQQVMRLEYSAATAATGKKPWWPFKGTGKA